MVVPAGHSRDDAHPGATGHEFMHAAGEQLDTVTLMVWWVQELYFCK